MCIMDMIMDVIMGQFILVNVYIIHIDDGVNEVVNV